MRAELALSVELSAERFDEAGVERQTTGERDGALDAGRADQVGEPARDGEMDALQDVGRGDPARHQIDDVGFREHGADAGDRLGHIGLERQGADIFERHAQIARDVLEELAGAARALAGHAVAQHAGARIHADGAGMERAHIEGASSVGNEEERAAGVRGHAVEVASAEGHPVTVTC